VGMESDKMQETIVIRLKMRAKSEVSVIIVEGNSGLKW